MLANPVNACNRQNPKECYIKIFRRDGKPALHMDYQIAELLGMDINDYCAILRNNFGAEPEYGVLKYNNWQDAERAAEWINAAMVASKLAGILNV